MTDSIGGRRNRAASDAVLYQPADAAISASCPTCTTRVVARREPCEAYARDLEFFAKFLARDPAGG